MTRQIRLEDKVVKADQYVNGNLGGTGSKKYSHHMRGMGIGIG